MRKMKLMLVRIMDWIDAHVLNHCFYPRLCNWLALHSWWDWNDKERETLEADRAAMSVNPLPQNKNEVGRNG